MGTIMRAEDGFHFTQTKLEEGTERVFVKEVLRADSQPVDYWSKATDLEREEFLSSLEGAQAYMYEGNL